MLIDQDEGGDALNFERIGHLVSSVGEGVAVVIFGFVGLDGSNIGRIFFHGADTDDPDSFAPKFLMDFLHVGTRFFAWSAPGCPEVDEYDFASHVGIVQSCPVCGFDAEAGSGFSFEGWSLVLGDGIKDAGDGQNGGEGSESESSFVHSSEDYNASNEK